MENSNGKFVNFVNKLFESLWIKLITIALTLYALFAIIRDAYNYLSKQWEKDKLSTVQMTDLNAKKEEFEAECKIAYFFVLDISTSNNEGKLTQGEQEIYFDIRKELQEMEGRFTQEYLNEQPFKKILLAHMIKGTFLRDLETRKKDHPVFIYTLSKDKSHSPVYEDTTMSQYLKVWENLFAILDAPSTEPTYLYPAFKNLLNEIQHDYFLKFPSKQIMANVTIISDFVDESNNKVEDIAKLLKPNLKSNESIQFNLVQIPYSGTKFKDRVNNLFDTLKLDNTLEGNVKVFQYDALSLLKTASERKHSSKAVAYSNRLLESFCTPVVSYSKNDNKSPILISPKGAVYYNKDEFSFLVSLHSNFENEDKKFEIAITQGYDVNNPQLKKIIKQEKINLESNHLFMLLNRDQQIMLEKVNNSKKESDVYLKIYDCGSDFQYLIPIKTLFN